MKSVKVETPIGVLDWTKKRPGVPYNVVPTPIPGGQWRKVANKYKVDFIDLRALGRPRRSRSADKLKPYTT